MTTYCTERTPSRDPRDHVCRRNQHHPGPHACTCGLTWKWIDERHLPHYYPDIKLEEETA